MDPEKMIAAVVSIIFGRENTMGHFLKDLDASAARDSQNRRLLPGCWSVLGLVSRTRIRAAAAHSGLTERANGRHGLPLALTLPQSGP